MKGLVYLICCKDDFVDDFYIGSTVNLERRIRQHKYNSLRPFSKEYDRKNYKAIRDNKGWDNWDIVVLEECIVNNIKQLRKVEQKFISELKPNLNKFLY